MHAEGRNTDVQGFDADFCRCQRTDGATAFHIRARYKALHRHLGLLTQKAEYCTRLAVGRVAFIGVDLDYRSMIQQRTVVFIMTVTEVGMDAVGIIR